MVSPKSLWENAILRGALQTDANIKKNFVVGSLYEIWEYAFNRCVELS